MYLSVAILFHFKVLCSYYIYIYATSASIFVFVLEETLWKKLILKWSITENSIKSPEHKSVAFSFGYFYFICLPVLFLGAYFAISHWKIKILSTNKYFNLQTHTHAYTQPLHPAHPVTEQVIHLYASPRETLGVTYSLLLSFSLSLDSCRGCVMTVMLILSCKTEMMTEWKKGGRDCSNKVLSISQPRSGELLRWGVKLWSTLPLFSHWEIISVWFHMMGS